MVYQVSHHDNNGDNLCDYGCGTSMGSQIPSQPEQPSESGNKRKYCGETHNGILGRIIQFFHDILYFFKNMFAR